MSVTGERDDKPGGGPQKVGVPIIDLMTGMYAAVSVLAALARRNETGVGDAIDIGMLDVQVATLANQAMNYLLSGRTPQRTGNAHPNIQPQDVFRTRDGELILVVGNDGQFAKLCEVLGESDWAQDERFATNPQRVRNLSTLRPMLAAELAKWARDDIVAALDRAGVPAGAINSVPEVFADPQVQHRQMLRQVSHPSAGTAPLLASPMRFAEAALGVPSAPPILGQHAEAILAELGYDAATIAGLRTQGAIG